MRKRPIKNAKDKIDWDVVWMDLFASNQPRYIQTRVHAQSDFLLFVLLFFVGMAAADVILVSVVVVVGL
jgi:hypothetical protein